MPRRRRDDDAASRTWRPVDSAALFEDDDGPPTVLIRRFVTRGSLLRRLSDVLAGESSGAARGTYLAERGIQGGVLKPIPRAQRGGRHDALARRQHGAELTERQLQREVGNGNP